MTQNPEFLEDAENSGFAINADDFDGDETPLRFEKPILVVKDTVLFPQILTSLLALKDHQIAVVEVANSTDDELIVITQRNPESDELQVENLHSVGVVATVVRHLKLPDGTVSVLVQGHTRVRITDWKQLHPLPIAEAEEILEDDLDEEPQDLPLVVEAQMRAVLALFEKCANLHPHIPEDAFVAASNVTSPGWMADLIASVMEISVAQRQALLEAIDPMERLQRLTTILAHELDVLELENRIHNQVQQEVDRSQREYFLREQIRVMKNELGEGGGALHDVDDLREKLLALTLPDEVYAKATKELDRLADMPPMAPEVGIIRTYLDWIIELPWHTTSEDNLDIDHAEQILDQNHYGLQRTKERILEYIAVRARTQGKTKLRSPILCFVGPPGTGKTSLGKSIAEALGRKFARISLGGIRDEAEIRGHRRTYIGAMPGRLLQTMKRMGTVNPLIMLDEIDKVGTDYRGDPTAALLEALDPEQNNAFSDHYLDLPYDLSQVLFITTANLAEPIHPALADRMEIIDFDGYIDTEKMAIARNFLIPRRFEEYQLTAKNLRFSDDALESIIRHYTYEAGVRNLDREIGRISRKVIRRLAQKKRAPKLVTAKNIEQFLGPQKFLDSFSQEQDGIGIATGLAWTAGGGDTLTIEVSLYDGKGTLTLTGHLGEVMRESVQAALSYTKANAKRYGIKPSTFEKTDVHVHIPEGATPKDGPSAGITVTVALISAFAGKKVKRHVAMTGEVTLRGQVLPVGGLRAKATAAHRAGIKDIIIPIQNQKDLVDIPKTIKKYLNFIPVAQMETVLSHTLVSD